jgi:endonuclease YncB( thermonuclease family)
MILYLETRREQMESKALAVAVVVMAALMAPASGQTVVDGDTIKLNGTTYRIWGIDAAETKQACADGWMAGQEASKAMLEWSPAANITCEARVTDRYVSMVALCRADGRGVRASMVRAGRALA